MTATLVSLLCLALLALGAALHALWGRRATPADDTAAEDAAEAHGRAVAEADARAREQHAAAEQVRKAGAAEAEAEHAEAERIRGESPAEVFEEIARRRAHNDGG